MNDQETDRQAIENAVTKFIVAYNAGDLDGLLNYYTDDLVKFRHGVAPETKSDIASRLKTVFQNYQSRVEVTNDETEISGDMAFTRGSYRVTLTSRNGGDQQIFARRYLEIWRKEAGRWTVVRAMDNEP